MRINKFIARSGFCSRRKAEEYVKKGDVKVNGKVVTSLSTDIDVKKDEVSLNGNSLKIYDNYVYYMLNKPKGYLTTLKDDRGRRTIATFLSKIPLRVFPVGRLDYDSEGLLLLTNDGNLTYKLTHPKFLVSKKYIVKINGNISKEEVKLLSSGVTIRNEKFGRCKIKVLSTLSNQTRLEVILHEGKNREIRKIFGKIGKEVVLVKRVEMAGIKLGGLKRGEIRPLKNYEIKKLKSMGKTA